MRRKEEGRFIKYLLETMEPMRSSPVREIVCTNFDAEYVRLKDVYKEITGKEWEGEGE